MKSCKRNRKFQKRCNRLEEKTGFPEWESCKSGNKHCRIAQITIWSGQNENQNWNPHSISKRGRKTSETDAKYGYYFRFQRLQKGTSLFISQEQTDCRGPQFDEAKSLILERHSRVQNKEKNTGNVPR